MPNENSQVDRFGQRVQSDASAARQAVRPRREMDMGMIREGENWVRDPLTGKSYLSPEFVDEFVGAIDPLSLSGLLKKILGTPGGLEDFKASIDLPDYGGPLEIGPESVTREARQDATAQAQVSKLFR